MKFKKEIGIWLLITSGCLITAGFSIPYGITGTLFGSGAVCMFYGLVCISEH